MNQQERLNYLVESFKEDSGEYRNLQVGDSEEEKRTVLRSLMNIRMPGSISETVLKIQNEFLTEDAKEKGIVSLDSIPTVKEQYGSSHPFADKISVWQVRLSMPRTARCLAALCLATDALIMPSILQQVSSFEMNVMRL